MQVFRVITHQSEYFLLFIVPNNFFIFSLGHIIVLYILFQLCTNHSKSIVLYIYDLLNDLYFSIASSCRINNFLLWSSIFCRYFLLNDWVLFIFDFILITPLYISINCDANILIIIAACTFVLRRCLFCLSFLTYRWKFNARFILLYFLISVGYPFFRSRTSCLVRFHLLLVNLYLTFNLAFYCCV